MKRPLLDELPEGTTPGSAQQAPGHAATAEIVQLSKHGLPRIADRVSVPTYDRGLLTPGILHFGVGNFHRAHQALYLDALFNLGLDHDWAVIGAGLQPSDETMRKRLAGQNWLTTVVEQGAVASTARVVGSMIDFLPVGDTAAIIDTLADPAIRIVSLTITEGSYFIDSASGEFAPSHPDIVHDGANPDRPNTVFGCILAGLKRRRAARAAPFTVMSCDNLPSNGEVTRNAVAGLAELSDPEFAQWVRETVAFPNAMVDRITPVTGDRERRIAAEHFGVRDAAPVFCEDFKQWVLEDHFPAGRPAFHRAGVQLVKNVAPYETMKIRILNGGHAIVGYSAALMGIHFVHDAMENRLVSAFLDKVECEEVLPHVPPVPDTDRNAYFQLIKRRFANPKTGDTNRRLCLDGSNRQPKFIVPSIKARLDAGGGVRGLALESALWCRYCHGTMEAGTVIEPNDPNWDQLQARARAAKENPVAWLAMEEIYGNVGKSSLFRVEFAKALTSLWNRGTSATIRTYLADDTDRG